MKRLATVALAALAAALAAPPVHASSHAEAPLIAEDRLADNTDVYFFRSPENPSRAVILANYIPMEEPSGGPTYFYFSDQVLYEVHVDRNQDGKDDVTFQFRFKTRVQTPGTLLPYLGPITNLTTNHKTVVDGNNVGPTYNKYQTYSVTMVESGRRGRTQVLAENVIVPPNNAGPATCPNFAELTSQALHTINLGNAGSMRTYAGQIDDPFYLDLGAIFDLLRVRPFRELHALQSVDPRPGRAIAPDSLSGFNCHTIALEIPITFLTGTGAIPGGKDPARVLGVYASSSRKKITVLRAGKSSSKGAYVQVSRLGAPLVNELFMPIDDAQGRTRDAWNGGSPDKDEKFRSFFEFPEPALRLAQLYPALRPVIPNINKDATGFAGARTDLLGGATPLLNFVPDYLRLDVSVPPNPTPNRLGALAGDAQGFPNGRRIGDDVVDIYIRAAVGALVPGKVGGMTRNAFLDSIHLGDGVDEHENGRVHFLDTFPFAATAHNGVLPAHVGVEDPERAPDR